MISQLTLTNFRCFDEHRVDLRPMTVAVGRNNAGKSTLVEALRLVSLVANRFRHLSFAAAPRWSDFPRRARGVSPSLHDFDFNFDTVFHRYGDPPATVRAAFAGGAAIEVQVGPAGAVFAVIYGSQDEIVQTKAEANLVQIEPVNILPQIGPLQESETILAERYVRRSLSSRLASLHFRNQLYLLSDAVAGFEQLAESTWKGLHLDRIEVIESRLGTRLHLTVRDGDFATEVGLMGHGLQMWLQTIWFLARAPDTGAVILDEPDVYMHADLQRRLVRLVRGRFGQIIIATHSVEIMAEVAPEDILVVDRSHRRSRFATSIPGVQQVIERLGGVHNLHLARLSTSKKFLLVEGDDLGILGPLHQTLFPASDPLGGIPNGQIGGWSGWQKALGSALVLKNAGDQRILVYCLLDRDFHTDTESQERIREATERGIQLHVWDRKEIENYLLVPAAIQRIVDPNGRRKLKMTEIERKMDALANELRDATHDAIANDAWAKNKRGGVADAVRTARATLDAAWTTLQGRLAIVAGKEMISKLSDWTQKTYGVSFSAQRLAYTLRRSEIPSEVARILEAVEQVRPLT